MNQIAPITYSEVERLAQNIARSKLFGIQTPEQAVTLMMISQAEGRHPALAARDYDIIQGRPAKKSEAMQRDFLEGGGKIEWHALSDEIADATFSHPHGGSVRITWDMARAAKAALSGKDNYKRFPRQMLRSRCVSEGVRTIWPMATSGMYVREEVADMEPPHTGPTIDAEPEQPSARDAINAEVPIRSAAAAAPRPQTRSAPDEDAKWKAFTAKVYQALTDASTRAEVEGIAARQSVADAVATGPAWVRRDLSEMLADAYGRFPEDADSDAANEPENAAA